VLKIPFYIVFLVVKFFKIESARYKIIRYANPFIPNIINKIIPKINKTSCQTIFLKLNFLILKEKNVVCLILF